ncbi:MAG: hypothetical protein ACFE95_06285 [Candidatus Hodarchaeota archaeon]
MANDYKNIIINRADIDPYSVTFQRNIKSPIHRWYPYKEGFSQSFVRKIFGKYKVNNKSRIIDPFAGSGTVLVEAKKKDIFSAGFELNPFIHFLAKVKLTWNIDITILERILQEISQKYNFLQASKKKDKRFIQATKSCSIDPPNMNTLHKFYDEFTIKRLLILKEYWHLIDEAAIRNILMLIFSSLLVDMSNAARSPSLGYKKSKIGKEKKVWEEFIKRLSNVIEDLKWIQKKFAINNNGYLILREDNRTSKALEGENLTHVITSPPYINNIDYIRNSKLELFWCDFVKTATEFYQLKKIFSRSFLGSVEEDKLINVLPEITMIAEQVKDSKPFNKKIPAMITAYFSDIKSTFVNLLSMLETKAKLVIVIGDSCFAGVHIPTDLLISKIMELIGYKVNKIEIVRFRRSTFHKTRLRESIIHLEWI